MKPKPKTYALFLAKWREPIEAMQLEPAERVALDDYIISRFIDDQPQPIDSLTGKASSDDVDTFIHFPNPFYIF